MVCVCTCTDVVGIQGTPGDGGTGAELGGDVDDGMDGRGATVGGGHCLEHTPEIPNTHHPC